MLKDFLDKLSTIRQTPEVLFSRRRIECIAQKLERLKEMEPKSKEDFLDTQLVLSYVKFAIEVNLEIAEIYLTDWFNKESC